MPNDLIYDKNQIERERYRLHMLDPQWRERKQARQRINAKKYRSNPEVKIKIKSRFQRWYQANRETQLLKMRRSFQDNKEKYYKSNREWFKANPDRRYKKHVKETYGITLEQFNQMLIYQDNKCAICFKVFSHRKDRHIDHDHKTGRVRAILCRSCNNGLGMFKDDMMVIKSATAYLEKWRAQ